MKLMLNTKMAAVGNCSTQKKPAMMVEFQTFYPMTAAWVTTGLIS